MSAAQDQSDGGNKRKRFKMKGKSPHSIVGSSSTTPAASPSSAASSSSQPPRSAKKEKRFQRRLAEKKAGLRDKATVESTGTMGVIDLTEMDSDVDEEARSNGPGISAKRTRKRKGDGKRNQTQVVSSMADVEEGDKSENKIGVAGPGPSTLLSRSGNQSTSTPAKRPIDAIYTPTSFQPLKRSMASGYVAASPSPPPSQPIEDTPITRPTADILIEEKPIQAAEASSGPNGTSEHFNPPGLFSSSLVPTSAIQPAFPILSEADSESKLAPAPLLLPSHVQVDEVIHQGAAEIAAEAEAELEESKQSMEGLFVFDTDVAKGAARYFDPDATEDPQGEEATFLATADQSKICTQCKKPGHKPRDCPHIVCTVCGEMDAHERRDCPFGVTCFACGERGHRINECPNPFLKNAKKQNCRRCNSREHKENSCPSLWRIYVYHSTAERQSVLDERRKEQGWAKEAVGGESHAEFCYNCARMGHLGDDCSARRNSLARLTTPSAFSHQMSSSGPFASTSSHAASNVGTSTHRRFDDDDSDLPGISKPFAGLGAGRKTRENDRRRMAALERDAMSSGDEEEDTFLHSRNNSSRGGGRGGGWGRGGSSNRGTPNQHPSRRAWDSEHRERERGGGGGFGSARGGRRGGGDGNMPTPFSHSHLMSPTIPASLPVKPKGIVFGNIAGLPARPDSPSPYPVDDIGTGTRGDWKSRASKALTDRAMGYASAPTSRSRSPVPSPLGSQSGDSDSSRKKKKRKQDSAGGGSDRDFEEDWRGQGNGGGNVRDWGKADDEADRVEKKRDNAAKFGKGKGKGSPGTPVYRGGGGGGRGGRGGGSGGRGGGNGGGASQKSKSSNLGGPSQEKKGKQGPSTPIGQRYTGGY